MKSLDVVYYPNELLETKCEKITEFNSELHELLDSMKVTMLEREGMGLSANQVGASLRVFIMLDKNNKVWEFVNPEIVSKSEEESNLMEGCLSSPGVYQWIPGRANSVQVKAQDREGKEFSVVAEGIEAVCVQHESDHLDGIFWLKRIPSRPVRRKAEKQWQKLRKKLKI